MTYKFLIIFLFIIRSAIAAIIETSSFSDLLKEVDSETLVFVDLDETMVTSSRMLGSQQWWTYMQTSWNRIIDCPDAPKNYFNELVNFIFDHVPEVPVEENTTSVVRILQERGITVLSLTARMKKSPWDPCHDITTSQMLQKLGIHLTILFTEWKPKGPYVRDYIQNLTRLPKKIVMIDDTLSQIKSVESVLLEMKIPFKGIHYTRLKQRELEFDPAIGNIQLEALQRKGILLTDTEARQLKEGNSEQINDHYFEDLLLHYKEKSGMLIPH